MIKNLQREVFQYFLREVNLSNGLIRDKSTPSSPCSIAVQGLGLSAYLIAVENAWMTRAEASSLVLKSLRFLWQAPQNDSSLSAGYQGFFYHFLDFETGLRHGKSEISTIDTALLMAGVLSAAQYFQIDTPEEIEIRSIAKKLYERVNWQWAVRSHCKITHGWTPEKKFLRYHWGQGYSEAMILYLLALGSPTFPVDPRIYTDWTKTFEWIQAHDLEYFYAGPLFIHQLSHAWIDFRNIRDDACRERNTNYFENSQRATLIHQRYAQANPKNFAGYSDICFGLTASDGPGPRVRQVKGKRIRFYDYVARGAPFGPDDGTVSPWAAVASLPFAPEAVSKTIHHAVQVLKLPPEKDFGFRASFNESYSVPGQDPPFWVSPHRFGINHGPIVIMIENHLTQFLWDLMRHCSPLKIGLAKAGFRA